MKGRGAFECKAWTKWRGLGPTDADRVGVENWISGYLSGKAIASGIDMLKGTSADAIEHAVDERCKLKPEENIFEAVNAVADKLK